MLPAAKIWNSPSDLGVPWVGLFWVWIRLPQPHGRFLEVKDCSPPYPAPAGHVVGLGEDWMAWLIASALKKEVTMIVTEMGKCIER